jgi:GT2 family glycosyltransferase
MKIAVVLVTYNREDCLHKALECYDKQTRQPDLLLVVDNASTDGTSQFLDQWQTEPQKCNVHVLHMTSNTGGAGGFAAGLKFLNESDYDWALVADDDAYAEHDVLEKLCEAAQRHSDASAVCSSVINEGRIDTRHRSNWQVSPLRARAVAVPEEVYSEEESKVDILTFVGAFINLSVSRQIGIPEESFFIYYDDMEYSLRLLAKGSIYLIPDARMHHNTGFSDPGFKSIGETTWKSYYGVRNQLVTWRRYAPGLPYYIEVALTYIKKISPLATLLRNRTYADRQLYRAAMHDAKNGAMGLHGVYKPGWHNLTKK